MAHDFYQNSYFSIYVESNYNNPKLVHLTEKTYEPLLKEHLILPVTNPGSIDYLKSRGFKFSVIDYSFDSIDNYEERFNLILREFHKVLEHSRDIYMSCLDDVKHNLEVFKLKQYDRRILQIFNR